MGATAADSSATPVPALKDMATKLEAAVLECLDKPRQRAVHKVRTSTRRIEAQLNLLPLAGGFPAIEREAAKMRTTLKKLRGAAGDVRDLDVQEALVEEEAKASPENSVVCAEARRLGKKLRRRRDKKAARLVKLLGGLHRKLPERVRDLTDALEQAETATVEEARLVKLIREWYGREVEPHWDQASAGDPDALHSIRKVAKVARYLAEIAPEGAGRAGRLAEHFETLQKAGGEWHDWVLLAGVAAEELGKRSELPQRFEQHAQDALGEFRRRLGMRA